MEQCDRPLPPYIGSEKQMFLGFLDFQRDTVICKLDGVSEEDARQCLEPSALTLIGIASHLAWVEKIWFRGALLGENLPAAGIPDEPARYWQVSDDTSIAEVIALYREAISRSNAIIEEHDLHTMAVAPRGKRPPMQLRWIVNHMIEETARHAGHMDLIREAIDGEVGA